MMLWALIFTVVLLGAIWLMLEMSHAEDYWAEHGPMEDEE